MATLINTCSGAISFARELETKSAQFYNGLSQKYAKEKELFLSLAEENGAYITQVERAYYGVITDALEGCFAFNMNGEAYGLPADLDNVASYLEALKRAIAMEERITKFYSDAADQSKSLMADVPRAFSRVAKKRAERISKLKSLLTKETG